VQVVGEVQLVERQIFRSSLFPGQPQEAGRSVAIAQKVSGRISLTTSSSPSLRVDGSGIPPSMTHRLDSYLVRMKFSIFL